MPPPGLGCDRTSVEDHAEPPTIMEGDPMSRRTRGAVRRPARVASAPALEPLEVRRLFSTLAVLTTNDHILTVDSDRTRALVSDVAVTGLQAGESLVVIDVRPATGELYGLGSANRLYTMDARTGAATLKATLSAPL